jgi:hypothetical protein
MKKEGKLRKHEERNKVRKYVCKRGNKKSRKYKKEIRNNDVGCLALVWMEIPPKDSKVTSEPRNACKSLLKCQFMLYDCNQNRNESTNFS